MLPGSAARTCTPQKNACSECCAALSALPELQGVPVIFITAFDDAEHKVRAFASGGRDFVTKPFQAPEVLARVDTHVRLHRMDRELREQNVRLVRANTQLEQMADMRARISAMLVHDIRSPLTVIGAALEEPGDKEAAEDARTAYGKILRLIQELLELYRGDYEAGELRRRTINVTELVRGAVNAARVVARKIGVSLELTEASVPEAVRGDSERLDRVLANLLENALKFTPKGGTVTVSTATEPGVGVEAGLRFAVIAVVDTGPGIPAEDFGCCCRSRRRAEAARFRLGSKPCLWTVPRPYGTGYRRSPRRHPGNG